MIMKKPENRRISGAQVFFFMGFSLLKGMEFFAFRKMEYPETINHPLGGWETIGYAKITFPNTIKLFRLYCRKER